MGPVVRRANVGCGSVQPEGWDNIDVVDYGQQFVVDITDAGYQGGQWHEYDYIVANHLLSCFSHHELIGKVFPNLRSMLKKGGVLRVLVPDARKAVEAYLAEDTGFFPLGDDLPDVSQRFCTFLPWFGESKSIFDEFYLGRLAIQAGFSVAARCDFGCTRLGPEHTIAALDDREAQSLIMEFQK